MHTGVSLGIRLMRIQVTAEPAVTSKRVKTLLGYSFWWYQLMGFSWLRMKVRRDPGNEASFKKGVVKGSKEK